MKSYNGVATLSLREPDRVIYGLDDHPDSEDARTLQTVIDGIPIVNSYVPQGSSVGSEKFAFKLEWFRLFREYLGTHLHPDSPAIWVGDLNVAPEAIDVYDPDRSGAAETRFSLRALCSQNSLQFPESDFFRDIIQKENPKRTFQRNRLHAPSPQMMCGVRGVQQVSTTGSWKPSFPATSDARNLRRASVTGQSPCGSPPQQRGRRRRGSEPATPLPAVRPYQTFDSRGDGTR